MLHAHSDPNVLMLKYTLRAAQARSLTSTARLYAFCEQQQSIVINYNHIAKIVM